MIEYMQRTRSYYATLGYPPYEWAHFDEVPFTPAPRLENARLTLLSTAAPFRPDLGDQGANAPYNADAKFFEVYTTPLEPLPDLRISHLGYDRTHCDARDPNTWLPVRALQKAAAEGMIGSLNDTLIGLPTNRSHRVTTQIDAQRALDHCRALNTDVALLVPT